MPRLIHKPPAYSLHKPSGLAKVKYQGRITYLGKYGTPESKEAYGRFVATLPKTGESPAPTAELAPGETLLVSEIVLRYYHHAKAYYTKDGLPTGEHITVRCALRPLVANFGQLKAVEFGPKKLKKLQAAMIELDFSRYYVNKACGIVRRCFSWAASEELIPASVALALKTVPGLKKGRTTAREMPAVGVVSDADIEATLLELKPMIADMVRIQRLTGMRPGELLVMTPADIDRTDPGCWVYTPGRHKTEHHGKGRAIYIGPRASEILAPRLVQAGSGRIFRLKRDPYRQSVLRACDRAKVAPWTPNQLRHSAATQFRREFGLEAAQVLLGHSRADVTQTYAERDMKKAQEVARKIG